VRRAALTIVATIVGLVLLLQFKTHPGGSTGALVDIPTGSRTTHHRINQPSPASAPSQTPAPRHTNSTQPVKAVKPRSVTSTGQTVQTPYGPVQVKIVETAGALTDIVALQLPSGNPRSTEIAAGATPILRSEALRINSARIHVVSGATYTSDGYAQSLQSAIDNA